MKKNIFLFISIFIVGACKSPKKISNSQPNEASAIAISQPKNIFTLATTACYGTCPVFEISIFDNDSLVYNGQNHVKVTGQISKKLPKGTVEKLQKQFKEANFFEFKNIYEMNISDLPTTYISFTDNDQTKKIKDYAGSPNTLKQLESLLRALVEEEVKIQR